MSGSIQDFFEDVEDRLDRAADDVETEIRDVANDVEREGNDVINEVDADRGAPSTTSPAAQVTRLYDTVLDRRPDDAGLTFWTNSLRAGVGLDDLAEVFVQSPEFRDRYGSATDAEFVALLYRNTLNREPDAAGQAFWTDSLANGRADRDDVVLAFSESAEHVNIVGPVSTNDNPLI